MKGDAYDQFNASINFTDPYRIAEAISKVESEQDAYGYLNLPRDSKMFDIGQGTGIMGKLLVQAGYSDIMGADASAAFCNEAREHGWYKDIRELFFGLGVDKLPADYVGQFDVVMASGVFMDGHISPGGLDDAHAMCKSHGYFVTAMRAQYYVNGEEHGYKDRLDELTAAGKLELLSKKTFKRGIPGSPNPLFMEMDSLLLVYKRLD